MRNPTRLTLTTFSLALVLAGCSEAKHSAPTPASAPVASTVGETAAAPAPAPVAAEAPSPAPAEAPVAVKPVAPVAVPAPSPAPSPAPAVETALAEGPEVGNRIPEYTATVTRPGASPKTEQFDTHEQKKLTVYIMNSTTCPYCTQYIDRMKEVEAKYMAKGVDVVHVYPVQAQSAESKAEHHQKHGFKGGLIDDTKSELAKALDIEKTPTAILTDPQGKILYRGRIDDNAKPDRVKVHELADAIDQTLAGRPVEVTTTEPFG